MTGRPLTLLATLILALAAAAGARRALADVVQIEVGANAGNFFEVLSAVPGQGTNMARIAPGDTVLWVWSNGIHSVTADDGSFDSMLVPFPFMFEQTFTVEEVVGYYCTSHGLPGRFMFGTIVVGAPCPGDVDLDGLVNIIDLFLILFAYGQANAFADLNADGTVNVFDLLIVLAGWGPCV